MRKAIIAVALSAALGATFAAPLATARESFDTEITLLGGSAVDDDFFAYGKLESDKAKCRKARVVQLLVDPGSGYEVRDATRSSTSGAWAVWGDTDDASGILLKVLRARLPNGDTCKAATLDITHF